MGKALSCDFSDGLGPGACALEKPCQQHHWDDETEEGNQASHCSNETADEVSKTSQEVSDEVSDEPLRHSPRTRAMKFDCSAGLGDIGDGLSKPTMPSLPFDAFADPNAKVQEKILEHRNTIQQKLDEVQKAKGAQKIDLIDELEELEQELEEMMKAAPQKGAGGSGKKAAAGAGHVSKDEGCVVM